MALVSHQPRTGLDIIQEARTTQEDIVTQSLKSLASRLVLALRRGAMRRELNSLDDRMLADIGLRRDQIQGLCANAFGADHHGSAATGVSAELYWLAPNTHRSVSADRLAA